MHVIAILLSASVLVSAPWVDTRKRFTIDLPQGWKFAPQPGDTAGASFKRVVEGVPANASVRVLKLSYGIDLDSLGQQLEQAVQDEPGYRKVSEELDTLAGLPALKRRYVVYINGDPKWSKMVEEYIAMAGKRGFVLHVETVAEAFNAFQSEFDHLVASFKPKFKKGQAPPMYAHVFGKWQMVADASVELELRDNGTFELAGAVGAYTVTGETLVMKPRQGAQETFTWRMDGRDLVLTGGDLVVEIRYRRPRLVTKQRLHPWVGHWQGGGQKLHLSPGGACILNASGGTYKVDEGMLILRLDRRKKRVVLHYAVEGDTMTLSGGPFGSGTKVERTQGP